MKKCVVIYTEGETDKEFYDKVLDEIKNRISDKKFKVDLLKKECITGIAKFQKKLLNKFVKEVVKKCSKEYEIIVFLCYDTDVFEFGANPPVDRKKLEADLIKNGASKVFHIKATKTIEDFFTYDIDGICNFLKIPKPKNLKGTGLEKVEKMFLKANRIYQKGYKCSGFIASLDMNIIFPKICENIKPLCVELGLDENCNICKNQKMKKKK